MVPVNEFARRYLEDLLSFFGLNIRVEDNLVEEETTVELNVPSTRLNGFLIGQRGRNLRSIQHLTNMAVLRAGYEDMRVVVDVAGYKAQAARRLQKRTQEVAEGLQSGGQHEFQPMSPAERRVVHKTAGEIEGLSSESVGEGAGRRVVLKKQPEGSEEDKSNEDTPEADPLKPKKS